MKILFLTDNFPPESNAPATRTYEHCVEWVKEGAEVTVITCAPNYPEGKLFPGYKNKWWQEENIDGIRVIRVWTYITPNRGMFRRILDYISYCITAFFASLFVKTDVIIATSPQLFAAVAGYLSSTVKRKPWVMEVRDLWPESIKAVEAINQSKIIQVLDRVVLFLYRKADRVVVVTDAFKSRIHNCGVPLDNISVVKNGVHLHKFQPIPKKQNLLEQLGLQDKFIVAYIGTHGMAHKLDFILDCAAEVKNENIHFLFVGTGAMKQRLVRQAKQMNLQNVSLLDPVPKEKVSEYICISDVALINLRKKNTFTKVIPSKIFENAAMLKPILLGVEGEAQAIVESYQAGICFEPENKEDFLAKLDIIYSDKAQYAQFKAGCERLAKDFNRRDLAMKMYHAVAAIEGLPTTKSPMGDMSLGMDGQLEEKG